MAQKPMLRAEVYPFGVLAAQARECALRSFSAQRGQRRLGELEDINQRQESRCKHHGDPHRQKGERLVVMYPFSTPLPYNDRISTRNFSSDVSFFATSFALCRHGSLLLQPKVSSRFYDDASIVREDPCDVTHVWLVQN
jgi:hypothetical protein